MKLTESLKETLRQLYITDGLSSAEVARRLRTSESTALRLLHQSGVAVRHSGWLGGTYLSSDGYVNVLRPGHPMANVKGYVKRSILNWEEANQQPWPIDREPHHKNLDKLDDRADNVVPLTHSEHARVHAELKRANRLKPLP
jgi:hypothetical protein